MVYRNDTLIEHNGQGTSRNFSTPAATQKTSALYDYVIAATCRNRDVFTFAQTVLEPSDFNLSTNFHYGIIWDCVLEFYNTYNRLPDRELLTVDVSEQLRNIPNIPENVKDETFEFIEWIFGSDNDSIPTDAAISRTKTLAFTFHRARVAGEINHLTLDDAPGYFAELQQKTQQLHQHTLRPQPVTKGRQLRPAVIDGLLRKTEIGNIIGAPKIGKSWLCYHVGIAVAQGSRLFNKWPCNEGRVLIIDNELHEETIDTRIETVCHAMNVDIPDTLERLPLRNHNWQGKPFDLLAIIDYLRSIPPNTYDLIILDAWYRAIPDKIDENNNSEITQLYNRIDSITAKMNCAWLNIHHTSKGNQTEKSTTDVGAGAGAQSRAADTHVILRPHNQDDVFVLDAVVRTFQAVESTCLRWDYPLWTRDFEADPQQLRNSRQKDQEKEDLKGRELLLNAVAEHPGSTINTLAGIASMSWARANKLITQLDRDDAVHSMVEGKNTIWFPGSAIPNESR